MKSLDVRNAHRTVNVPLQQAFVITQVQEGALTVQLVNIQMRIPMNVETV